ncbi:MAG: hypothetical protein HYX47_21575 [Burkholderiales bacterium]|nr:hypothetical protein [Burkholderiales bacterium]
MHDRVCGPVGPFFVAVYAAEMGELGQEFLGYFKICRRSPDNYWDAKCIFKGCADEVSDSPEAAMSAAQARATWLISTDPDLIARSWAPSTKPPHMRLT